MSSSDPDSGVSMDQQIGQAAESSLSEVPGLLTEIDGLLDRLAAADLTRCSDAELVAVAQVHERAINRMTFQGNRQVLELSDRNVPRAMGFRSLTNFLNVELRVSDPARRKDQMAATGRFRELDGQLREPRYPTLATAFADGLVGPGHVRKAAEMLDAIPHKVSHDKQVAAEATLSGLAAEHTPDEINTLGQRILAHLDPDGELSDDADRKRQRNLWLNRQNAQQMSKLTAHLDPETRALVDMLLAVWAKPGLNNPNDPDSPSGAEDDADPDQLKAAAARDGRSQAQRNHDALSALLKAVFTDGLLGKTHRGLPVQLIIKVELEDLIAKAGFGTTATGSLLPMADVVRLAAEAEQYLAVFADNIPLALYEGRSKRCATMAQRLMSFAREDGEVCSAPGCDQPATHVEMHHAHRDWADGGRTDIVDLAPACPKHNRMVSGRLGDYTTGVYRSGDLAGRTWWRRNHRPGAPPNPARVNRRPDIRALFDQQLEKARGRIHHTEPDPPPSATYQLTETIPPPVSAVEARLAMALVEKYL
ncbi:HNH endonuclease signature motif containing protein [Gordonia sp. ABSL49_1]|uniref:HNH endonuclease signature motif containing protein n=1 Tax=unclassified Gordonia (in: high G+C Gram-positive bacteria) TaxID=2657482 RepID=UPI001F0F820A|nr:HNH endonuclease signature motif containing protein [Gordonia sp. ABSL49_1]MCH5645363.1 HNH endonuclease [Gordonia sp. ABSL49_1]